LGNLNTATGNGAVAIGESSSALTAGAVAIGETASASGANNVAIGNGATAANGGSTAVGAGAVANAGTGSAFGTAASATGTSSLSAGAQSTATALDATALGFSADATAANCVALGANTTCNVADTVNVGGRVVTGAANGLVAPGSTDLVTGDQVAGIFGSQIYLDVNSTSAAADAIGTNAIAIGGASVAGGTSSIAIGEGASAPNNNSVAIGAGTTTTADNQVNVGGRTIGGVAAGVAATDAVNVGQLNNAVSLIGDQIVDLGDRIDRVDKKASGGTAVAIALGGNAFLPNKQFNLTGNVGVYRSEVAAALQVGAMIGQNAAINAGVATGFNHNGKIGARAGFTIGW
jgi:autotransporter adhesin